MCKSIAILARIHHIMTALWGALAIAMPIYRKFIVLNAFYHLRRLCCPSKITN